MRNFIQPGDTITAAAPYDVASGAGALISTMFGVAAGTYANGAEGEFKLTGVFDFPAETHATDQALAVGNAVYWDNTNKRMTKTSSGNTKVGVAVLAKASTAATVRVRLNGSF